MGYREPDPPDVDHEANAIAALGRHAQQVRRRILLPAILGGVVLAIGGYLVVRELQFAVLHAQWPWLSGVVGSLPAFAATLRIGSMIGNAVVKRRAPAWARAAVRDHRLPEGSLDEYLDVL